MADEIEVYSFKTDDDKFSGAYSFNDPFNTGANYTINVRYHAITAHWLYKLDYKKGDTEISTGWRRLVLSMSLNYEYQNVMSCSVGFTNNVPYDPSESDDLNDNMGQFYITSWSSLQYM